MILEVSCRHNAGEIAQRFALVANNVREVPAEATREAVEHWKGLATSNIERIAHGVYWKVESDVDTSGDSTRGRVWTDKNRPHTINSHQSHGLLAWEQDGETVIRHGPIHHPGSRPVDWLTPSREQHRTRSIFSSRLRSAIRGI